MHIGKTDDRVCAERNEALADKIESSNINTGENDVDKILYEQFLDGNNQSFEQLVLKYKDNLIYFLQRYIKDISTCEDIAQDIFAWIYVFKYKYNFKFSVKTYLFTIARNKAVDFIRKNQRLISIEDMSDNGNSIILSEQYELAERVIQSEQAKLVHIAIGKLKQEYQSAIMLVDFEELSYSDAAKILDKSIPQFKILLFRARKSLKNMLGKEGYIHEN